MAVIVAYHDNIRHVGLDRTSELLCSVRRVNRGGERNNKNYSGVFETEAFVRPFNFGGVLCRGGCGGGIDRRCSSVGKVGRQGHGAVIGHGQVAKKRG